MAKASIIFGSLLIFIGLYSYFVVSSESITALIPAFLGVLLLILGVIGLNEKHLKTTMHIAVILMLIGFIGSFRGLLNLPLLLDGTAERPFAIAAQSVTAILALLFLILAVKSFISARRVKRDIG